MFFFQVECKHVSDGLRAVADKRLPFQVARLLSDLAADGRERIKQRMPSAFDRPTPFTVGGVSSSFATRQNLVATVFVPQSADASGRSAREYLRPGVLDITAARQQKKTEYLLTRMGYLPAGYVTVPGRYIQNGKLDGFGNMPGSYYKQIIRSLGIKNTKGPPKPASIASQRRASKMGVAQEFFAVVPGGNKLAKGGGTLPAGVYRREGVGGSVLRQYLKFVRRASYRQRLDMRAEVQAAINATLAFRAGELRQIYKNPFVAR